MSEAESTRDRIKAKVAASQQRLKRDCDAVPMIPQRANLPDAYPPENYRGLAAEYPLLTVAAGIGIGLLAGALLPKRAGSKVGQRALTLATIAGELGLALSKQAHDAAREAGEDGVAKVATASAPLRRRATRLAGTAGTGARSAGLLVAREAVKLAARVRNGA
ncbi:hypothetical protein ACFFF7_07765 [Novosphingobium aquiterrae]|uniref:DUF3618 domain-containing protein n=1 Tax=Novosphingobium aquiterrae TaxID=624388 RepID=A0ABV6PHK8_9SPHN